MHASVHFWRHPSTPSHTCGASMRQPALLHEAPALQLLPAPVTRGVPQVINPQPNAKASGPACRAEGAEGAHVTKVGGLQKEYTQSHKVLKTLKPEVFGPPITHR